MDKQIEILEGQTGEIVFKPLYENIPVPSKVKLDNNKSQFLGLIKPLSTDMDPDGVMGVLRFQALGKAAGECSLVFVYNNSIESVEGLTQQTKIVGLNILEAGLQVYSISPVQFDWVKGGTYTLSLKYSNGTEIIPTNSPDLSIIDSFGNIQIVSKTSDSISFKLTNDSTPGNDPAVIEIQLEATYFSIVLPASFVINVPAIPLPTSLKFTSTSFNMNTLSSGGVNMILTDDKGNFVPNVEFVSVSNDISNPKAFADVGTTLTTVDASKGMYRYPISSTFVPGRANFTFKFKIGSKEYTLNSVAIINYGTNVQTVASPTTIPKATDQPVTITMFARQQRTIDSQVYTTLQGKLNTETGVSGIDESRLVRTPDSTVSANSWTYEVYPDENTWGFTMNAILTEDVTGTNWPLKFTLPKV